MSNPDYMSSAPYPTTRVPQHLKDITSRATDQKQQTKSEMVIDKLKEINRRLTCSNQLSFNKLNELIGMEGAEGEITEPENEKMFEGNFSVIFKVIEEIEKELNETEEIADRLQKL